MSFQWGLPHQPTIKLNLTMATKNWLPLVILYHNFEKKINFTVDKFT